MTAWHQCMLGLPDPAAADAEIFHERGLGGRHFPAGENVDWHRLEIARDFCRWRCQRRFRRVMSPGCQEDLLRDRYGNLAAGLAVAKRPLLAGIVVTNPDRDGDVARESDKPSVVFVVGGPGLAADKPGILPDR